MHLAMPNSWEASSGPCWAVFSSGLEELPSATAPEPSVMLGAAAAAAELLGPAPPAAGLGEAGCAPCAAPLGVGASAVVGPTWLAVGGCSCVLAALGVPDCCATSCTSKQPLRACSGRRYIIYHAAPLAECSFFFPWAPLGPTRGGGGGGGDAYCELDGLGVPERNV